jgi:hypothetical protein
MLPRHLVVYTACLAGPLVLCTAQAAVQSPASLVIRLAVAAAAGGDEKPRGTRTEAEDRLAQGYTFNSMIRKAGVRFIIAADQTALANTRSASSSTVPILFISDPVARVPDLLAAMVRTQCDERLAVLEYLGTQEGHESYRITCGIGSGRDTVIATAAPGPAGTYAGTTKVQEIDYLRVRLDAIEVTLKGEVRVTLAFQNITDDDRGLAVAFFDQNSTGIADFWKFFPKADGALTDNAGNSFSIASPGLEVFGRTNADYVIVRPGTEASTTLAFNTRNMKLGSSLNLSLPIWLVTRIKGTTTQQRRTFTIRLTDIRPIL